MMDEQLGHAMIRLENLAGYLRSTAPVDGQRRKDNFDDANAMDTVRAALHERDRRIAELQLALIAYGSHLPDCPAHPLDMDHEDDAQCDCDWTSVLASLSRPEPSPK